MIFGSELWVSCTTLVPAGLLPGRSSASRGGCFNGSYGGHVERIEGLDSD